MIRRINTQKLQKIAERLERLYGAEAAPGCLERVGMLVGSYGVGMFAPDSYRYWDQGDIALITYGDMVRRGDEAPLRTLTQFLKDHVRGAVSTVHLLPFFPWSSDDGFSVKDYREVDPALGTWKDVKALGQEFSLMVDLVLNHVSRASRWMEDYVSGILPARRYFIEVDPRSDLSAVVRPRNLPLLTAVQTSRGERHLWTTFSDDQFDLNFANPDVLFEFLDILLLYISMGARIVRLDAIAYLWKKPGTSCIHMEETHEVVRLMRDFVDMVEPSVRLITETNVPHEENVSYFGGGEEAHVVYQFSLPPLLLYTLVTGDAAPLTHWAAELGDPPRDCTYLNFTASHDGIGVRPLQGLLPEGELERLVSHVEKCGGQVSTKGNSDGTESPYELNITYFDALGGGGKDRPGAKRDRFLCSQTIALALRGIPAVYFNSLVAAPNDRQGFEHTGRARSLNRGKWNDEELRKRISGGNEEATYIFNEYVRRLRLRQQCSSFHPEAEQVIHDLGAKIFAVERRCANGQERLVCISNVTAKPVTVDPKRIETLKNRETAEEMLGAAAEFSTQEPFTLAPYQTVWLRANGKA